MGRTIVMSDLHGRLSPLELALEHAGYVAASDRLIIAGDLIDVGTDDVISRASELGAEVLVGNHEVAAALGIQIVPQNPESLAEGPDYARRMVAGEWKMAAETDGWIITHAGISATMDDIIIPGDETATARRINDLFVDEMRSALQHDPVGWVTLESHRLLGGQGGPLWFRPWRPASLAPGLRQIAGHTSPHMLDADDARALESAGILLVDRGGHEAAASGMGAPRFRYAIVENGEARAFEG